MSSSNETYLVVLLNNTLLPGALLESLNVARPRTALVDAQEHVGKPLVVIPSIYSPLIREGFDICQRMVHGERAGKAVDGLRCDSG